MSVLDCFISVDVRGPSPPRAGPFPGQVVLGCIKKLAEHECVPPMVSAWVPALSSFNDGLWPGTVSQINFSFPKLLLIMVFVIATERQLEQLLNVSLYHEHLWPVLDQSAGLHSESFQTLEVWNGAWGSSSFWPTGYILRTIVTRKRMEVKARKREERKGKKVTALGTHREFRLGHFQKVTCDSLFLYILSNGSAVFQRAVLIWWRSAGSWVRNDFQCGA